MTSPPAMNWMALGTKSASTTGGPLQVGELGRPPCMSFQIKSRFEEVDDIFPDPSRAEDALRR